MRDLVTATAGDMTQKVVPHGGTRFKVHGDGRTRGDDHHGGELAAMTLYVARALAPIDGLLGVGQLMDLHLESAKNALDLTVSHDGEFGIEVDARLRRLPRAAAEVQPRSRVGSIAVEVEHLMNAVAELDLVAGCLLVSASGKVVADKLPGIADDAASSAGQRIKVAYDSFARFLGPPSFWCSYEWIQLVTAPCGDGIVVAVADLELEADGVVRTAQAAGAGLSHVDLDAWAAT